MVKDLTSGRIYKGSNAQIQIPVFPCWLEPTGVTNVSVDLYTATGTSIHKSVSGGTINLSGNSGTILLQPVELDVFEDGVLNYNDKYSFGGSSYTEDFQTSYYVKTPIPYTAISYATLEEVEAVEEQAEAVQGNETGKIYIKDWLQYMNTFLASKYIDFDPPHINTWK